MYSPISVVRALRPTRVPIRVGGRANVYTTNAAWIRSAGPLVRHLVPKEDKQLRVQAGWGRRLFGVLYIFAFSNANYPLA